MYAFLMALFGFPTILFRCLFSLSMQFALIERLNEATASIPDWQAGAMWKHLCSFELEDKTYCDKSQHCPFFSKASRQYARCAEVIFFNILARKEASLKVDSMTWAMNLCVGTFNDPMSTPWRFGKNKHERVWNFMWIKKCGCAKMPLLWMSMVLGIPLSVLSCYAWCIRVVDWSAISRLQLVIPSLVFVAF